MTTHAWVMVDSLAWGEASAAAASWAERGAQATIVRRFVDDGVELDPLVALGAYQGAERFGVCVDIDAGQGGPMAAREITTLSYLAPIAALVITGGHRNQVADHARAAAALLSTEQVNLSSSTLTLVDAANRPQPHNVISVLGLCANEAWVSEATGERALVIAALDDLGDQLLPNCLVIGQRDEIAR